MLNQDEDEDEDDMVLGFASAPLQLDSLALIIREQWLTRVNSTWNSFYSKGTSRRTSFKVRFVSKVKRIWLPEEEDEDQTEKVDEIDLNRIGRDAPNAHDYLAYFCDPIANEFRRWSDPLPEREEVVAVKTLLEDTVIPEKAQSCEEGKNHESAPLEDVFNSSEIAAGEKSQETPTADASTESGSSKDDEPLAQPTPLNYAEAALGVVKRQEPLLADLMTSNDIPTDGYSGGYYSALIHSICQLDFLKTLQMYPALQAVVKSQILKNEVPESLVREIFSETLATGIFAHPKNSEAMAEEEAEKCTNVVEVVSCLTKGNEKSGRKCASRVQKLVQKNEEPVSEEKRHISGSGDVSPYFSTRLTRSKVKHSTSTPTLSPRNSSTKMLSKSQPSSIPASTSVTKLTKEFEPHGRVERSKDTRHPVMIDTDWLQRKIERTDTTGVLCAASSTTSIPTLATASSSAATSLATPTTRAASSLATPTNAITNNVNNPNNVNPTKKKRFYNYAGRHFYSSEEHLPCIHRKSTTVKSEPGTPKGRKSTVDRNFSSTSLVSLKDKRKSCHV